MPFKLKIENFGKLSDAEIHIGQFTVFAGPNNTGKSSVSKLLYSLFDGMNANHALVYINNLIHPLRRGLGRSRRWLYDDGHEKEGLFQKRFLLSLKDEIDKIEYLVRSWSIDNFEQIEKELPKLCDYIKRIRELYEGFNQKQLPQRESKSSSAVYSDFESLGNSLNELYEEIKEVGAEDVVKNGVRQKIFQNIIQNFQVSDLSSLATQQEHPSKVSIDGIGNFKFRNSDTVNFDIKIPGLQQLQNYSRVIYLESPVYWKLKSALEDIQINPRFFRSMGRHRRNGVPGYFYDLASALRSEYAGDIAFPNLYQKLTSEDVVGGKISVSETGEVNFQENGRSFSLHLTAMGVVNLGIIALLIERKIIDKGTFLFIDEPEAHLHPAWQVIMAETLFELAKGGVNVVIATHSADILKWLEVHLKKNPDDEHLVALNKFPANGKEIDRQDFSDKIASIKQELTKPFADLYLEGI